MMSYLKLTSKVYVEVNLLLNYTSTEFLSTYWEHSPKPVFFFNLFTTERKEKKVL